MRGINWRDLAVGLVVCAGFCLCAVLVTALLSCGSAEAKPRPKSVEVHVAIVGNAISICDARNAFALTLRHLYKVQRRVPINIVYDLAPEMSGPELTLDNFWNRRIYAYWRNAVGTNPTYNRMVLLPPLQGLYFAGMRDPGCWVGGGFATVHVKYGSVLKTSIAVSHELGGMLSASDLSGGKPTPPPSIMDLDAGNTCSADYQSCEFNGISKTQIRACLGLPHGNTLCVGNGCKR